MIFDEIPYELKEHIFSYVTPNEWINTAKVSIEWMDLTLGCIKKIESCHLLILHHLAEFINQRRNTSYTWAFLLTLMPRLEHLECINNTEAFWRKISPICHQLKILDFKPSIVDSFDWSKMDITFNNLVELLWDGTYQGEIFPLNFLALLPKLQKIKVKSVQINAKWKKRIPKSVKHILLDDIMFDDEHQCSVNYLCQDSSVVETFSASQGLLPIGVSSKFSDETTRLKKLEFKFWLTNETTSIKVKNAFGNCRGLETVAVHGVIITDSWRRIISENVKYIDIYKIEIQENIRRDFSLDWLLQNYGCLQSLELRCVDWTGVDSHKFYSTENLKRLALDNHKLASAEGYLSMDIFSDICFRMIRGSQLVDVELCTLNMDESWRHIFPPTIKRLKLKGVRLSKQAQLVFSPQFICENPSNIQSLILDKLHGDLTAMDLHAFSGMQKLYELHLNLRLSGECLESILTHCSTLTDLVLRDLQSDGLTNIPRNLILPSLRKLELKEPVDQPSLLLQHFPNLRTADIAINPPDTSFSAIMNSLQVAETVDLKMDLSWDHLRHLIEIIEDTKYKYFGHSVVTIECQKLCFHWTNSVLNACRQLFKIQNSYNVDVFWININPSLPILRNYLTVPLSMDELSKQYHENMDKYYVVLYDSDDEY